MRTGKEKPYKFPTHVPACGEGGAIERIPGQAAWRCVNKNSYPQFKRKLYHFVGKHCFDIDGMGPKIVDALLENELISSYGDIFTLKRGDLLALPRFAEKSVDNLLSAIEKARTVELPRLINALSIAHVGEETAYLLAENFQFSISNLQKATKEELKKINGVGDIMADAIQRWFADKENKKNLNHLLAHVKITTSAQGGPSPGGKNSKLSGKTFVLTGTLSRMSRDEAKEKIRKLGGNISSAVSARTDYVVAGENPGSKYDDAKKLNVKIITEAEFLKLLAVI